MLQSLLKSRYTARSHMHSCEHYRRGVLEELKYKGDA